MRKIFLLVFSLFMFACEPLNRNSLKTTSSTAIDGCAGDNESRRPVDAGAETFIKENMNSSDKPLLFLLFKYDL